MNKNYQQLFREIVTILRRDYAGKDIMGDRFSPRYYTQAVGQAWNDSKLDDLLFLRYVNQMLACIGDRNLHLKLRTSEEYAPWSPGFYTRRYEDDLVVTAVTAESQLHPGDRIIAINRGSPAKHKALSQKDFYRGSVPEREDWNGLLKMAEYVDVLRPDGTEARIALRRHPLSPPELTPTCDTLGNGVLYLRPGPFEENADTAGFLEAHAEALGAAEALILDLRNGRGTAEEEILPLLPWICKKDTPTDQLLDETLIVNHSRLNCILKAAGLGDASESQEYIAELAAKADTGFREESWEYGELIPAMAPKTVVVLTDTWCRDAAETLVQAARRAGAYLIGRSTLGTIDTTSAVSYELDDRFVLTWPTALSRAAWEGNRIPGTGVEPDEYIPWTPEECREDILRTHALTYIHQKKT